MMDEGHHPKPIDPVWPGRNLTPKGQEITMRTEMIMRLHDGTPVFLVEDIFGAHIEHSDDSERY